MKISLFTGPLSASARGTPLAVSFVACFLLTLVACVPAPPDPPLVIAYDATPRPIPSETLRPTFTRIRVTRRSRTRASATPRAAGGIGARVTPAGGNVPPRTPPVQSAPGAVPIPAQLLVSSQATVGATPTSGDSGTGGAASSSTSTDATQPAAPAARPTAAPAAPSDSVTPAAGSGNTVPVIAVAPTPTASPDSYLSTATPDPAEDSPTAEPSTPTDSPSPVDLASPTHRARATSTPTPSSYPGEVTEDQGVFVTSRSSSSKYYYVREDTGWHRIHAANRIWFLMESDLRSAFPKRIRHTPRATHTPTPGN